MGREGGGSQCQVGPPLLNLGFCHAPPPACPLQRASVWRSHSALTRRLAGSGSRKIQPSPGAPRGCSGALLPRQAGVFGFRPAGVSGAWGPPASSPCQCLCWARWCLEELRTLRVLVTPGTGHEHTTDNFPQRRAPRTPVATGDGVRGGRSPGPPQAGGLCGAASPPFWSQPPPARPPSLLPLDEKDVRQS